MVREKAGNFRLGMSLPKCFAAAGGNPGGGLRPGVAGRAAGTKSVWQPTTASRDLQCTTGRFGPVWACLFTDAGVISFD